MGASLTPDNPFAQGDEFSDDNPFAVKSTAHKPLTSLELARLKRKNDLLNKVDKAQADESGPDYLQRLEMMEDRAASVAVPGGRLAMTALRNVANRARGTPESWNESARGNAKNIDRAGRELVKNNMGVHVPLLGDVTLADAPAAIFGFGKFAKMLPKGLGMPETAAAFTGANRALAPESESALSRAAGTAGHAALGAALPWAMGEGIAAGRMGSAWLRSKVAQSVDDNVVGRDIDMNAVGGPLYDMFKALGDLPMTKRLSSLLNSDLAQERIALIKKADPEGLGKLADNNAQVVHALYREIGNKAYNAQNGIDPTPLRNGLAEAIDESASKLGADYSTPLAIWRRGNQGMDAVLRGSATLRNAATGKTDPTKVLTESPAAFRRDYENPQPLGSDPLPRDAAYEGIAGELKNQPKITRWMGVVPAPSKALRAAPDLLDIARNGRVSSLGQISNFLRGNTQQTLGSGISASGIAGNPPAQNAATPPNNYPQQLAGILRNPVRGRPMGAQATANTQIGAGQPIRGLLPAETPSTISERLFNGASGPMPLSENMPSLSPRPAGLLPSGEPQPMLQRNGVSGAVRGVGNQGSTYESIIEALRRLLLEGRDNGRIIP